MSTTEGKISRGGAFQIDLAVLVKAWNNLVPSVDHKTGDINRSVLMRLER